MAELGDAFSAGFSLNERVVVILRDSTREDAVTGRIAAWNGIGLLIMLRTGTFETPVFLPWGVIWTVKVSIEG